MAQMTWNETAYQYEYVLPGGDLLTVSGDEFAEAVAEAEAGNPEAFEEMLEPMQWLALVGDNPNVEIIPAHERGVCL